MQHGRAWHAAMEVLKAEKAAVLLQGQSKMGGVPRPDPTCCNCLVWGKTCRSSQGYRASWQSCRTCWPASRKRLLNAWTPRRTLLSNLMGPRLEWTRKLSRPRRSSQSQALRDHTGPALIMGHQKPPQKRRRTRWLPVLQQGIWVWRGSQDQDNSPKGKKQTVKEP